VSSRDATRDAAARGIHELTAWAAGVDAAALPDEVVQRAVRVLFDDLAAIVGARDEPQVAAFHRGVLARADRREATVFRGGRAMTDCLSAAVANAVAADWLELDEGYRVTPCHAGLCVLPALLATAEARDLAARDVLRALVVAYEVVARVARCFRPSVLTQHSHARYAAVGAAAATALALRMPQPVLHAALTAAATLTNPGPRNHLVSGALVRNVWPAVGAWSGMMSVEWAQCGIGGAEDGFHDVYSKLLGSEAHPDELTRDLGRDYAILDGYTKIYACCQHLHSAVEATLAMRDEVLRAGTLVAIAAIAVETHPPALPLVNPRPATTLGAKFSLPHAVAAALVTGSGGADAFASTTLGNAAIAALRDKVSATPYAPLPDPPNDRPARVRIHFADGRSIVGECLSAQGGPDRPFAPTVLIDKVRALTETAYPSLAPVFLDLLRSDSARMGQGWASVVGDICA
jgi:2-methylcitrate dehydratase PrpD